MSENTKINVDIGSPIAIVPFYAGMGFGIVG